MSKPAVYNHREGNRAAQFPVEFQSRFQSDTVIVWYRNRDRAVDHTLVHTQYNDDPNAITQLNFTNLRRRDTGSYTVAIQNTFSELSPELRQVEATFTLDVTGQLCTQ